MRFFFCSFFIVLFTFGCMPDAEHVVGLNDSAATQEDGEQVDTFNVHKKQGVPETKEELKERKEVQEITQDAQSLLRQGENTDPKNTELPDQVVLAPDVPASFPGGAAAYAAYLKKNLHYPPVAFENEIRGLVTVRFIVEKSGRISGAKVIRSLGYGCDEAALKFVTSMPAWNPAQKQNQAVKTQVDLPLYFEPGH
ncbi:MAG: energy transducer TonB [Bacteroidia bacterium]